MGTPFCGVSIGSVSVRGRPPHPASTTAVPLISPVVAWTTRSPLTAARVTVVVATPWAFVIVGVLLILSSRGRALHERPVDRQLGEREPRSSRRAWHVR